MVVAKLSSQHVFRWYSGRWGHRMAHLHPWKWVFLWINRYSQTIYGRLEMFSLFSLSIHFFPPDYLIALWYIRSTEPRLDILLRYRIVLSRTLLYSTTTHSSVSSRWACDSCAGSWCSYLADRFSFSSTALSRLHTLLCSTISKSPQPVGHSVQHFA